MRSRWPRRWNKPKPGGEQLRLPQAVVPRPPVGLEDLSTDTENDPDGAEEFVALVRALRTDRPPDLAEKLESRSRVGVKSQCVANVDSVIEHAVDVFGDKDRPPDLGEIRLSRV
jgi:hypothetical protein